MILYMCSDPLPDTYEAYLSIIVPIKKLVLIISSDGNLHIF